MMKAEFQENFQQVSTENFEREMTMVYLMLKEEYSQRKNINFMKELGITEDILSVSCKDISLKLAKPERIIIPIGHKPLLKIVDVVLPEIIQKKELVIFSVRPVDIQVKIKDIKHIKVKIPSVLN